MEEFLKELKKEFEELTTEELEKTWNVDEKDESSSPLIKDLYKQTIVCKEEK